MSPLRAVPRLLRVLRILSAHGIDDLLPNSRRPRGFGWLLVLLPRPPAAIAALPRGDRLVLALTALGPIFVKFGQILSTRRDLVPGDVADALGSLQDRVTPFPSEQARAAIERSLGRPIAAAFETFDDVPLASASIAQVHAARLAGPEGGRDVVVKVLRPDIHARIGDDVALLRDLAHFVERTHPNADKIRPQEIVDEIESTLAHELDLQREGANASLLRRNFADSPDLHVPEVVWSHSGDGVLTLERVRGIPVDDLIALDAAGIDRIALAEKGVRLFYTQVFRDNFFHADAHAGNIWVDASRPRDPRFIALDFGIMGSLPERDLYWLAENFLALFRQDYARIAELHVRAGWMPATTRMDELEAAVRAVCEPYFTRPLSEISLGEVVVKLFETARRYQLTLQPQLILLQKTLLNIEGVGRMLHPGIDIWATAEPVLERVWRERRGPRAMLKALRRRVPDLLAAAPDMPMLAHAFLAQATSGTLELRIASDDPIRLERRSRSGQRLAVTLSLAASLLVAAVLIALFDDSGTRWLGIPMPAWLAGGASAIAFLRASRMR